MFYQNNGVNHEIRVGPRKKSSEGKSLNDGYVLGLAYNLFAQELEGGGYRQWTPGEKDGGTEWLHHVF